MTPSEYVALAMRTKNDLGEKNNIAKLKARYPEGYTDHAAIHRDVSAEQEAMARN